MPKRTSNYKDFDEAGYTLSDRMRDYMAERYPDMEPEGTFELFADNCLANDRIYANWDAAFRNYLRKPADWGGFVFREGMADPSWRQLIIEAKALGFRKPHLPIESADQYRRELRAFEPETDMLGGRLDASKILKSIPK